MKLKSFLITDKTLVPRNKWTTIKQIKRLLLIKTTETSHNQNFQNFTK